MQGLGRFSKTYFALGFIAAAALVRPVNAQVAGPTDGAVLLSTNPNNLSVSFPHQLNNSKIDLDYSSTGAPALTVSVIAPANEAKKTVTQVLAYCSLQKPASEKKSTSDNIYAVGGIERIHAIPVKDMEDLRAFAADLLGSVRKGAPDARFLSDKDIPAANRPTGLVAKIQAALLRLTSSTGICSPAA